MKRRILHLADLAVRYGLDAAEVTAFVHTTAFGFAVVNGDVAIDIADLERWESSVRLATEVIDGRPQPASPSTDRKDLP